MTAEESTTPEEQRDRIVRLYEATRAPLPGPWKFDTKTWESCAASGDQEGAQFAFTASAEDQPLPSSSAAYAEQMRELWNSLGIPATIFVDDTLTPPLHMVSYPAFGHGHADDDSFVIVSVAGSRVIFEGTSGCAPGDASALDIAESKRPAP